MKTIAINKQVTNKTLTNIMFGIHKESSKLFFNHLLSESESEIFSKNLNLTCNK